MDKLRILPKTTLFLILFLVWIFFKSVPFVIVSLAFASLSFFERYLKIKIPTSFSFCFVVFVILSLVLGSYWWFYEKFSWWDDMLHFSYWVGFSVIWYLLILVMWRKAWIEKHYVLIVIFSFCFSVCFWAIWEIYEYCADLFFWLNMQKTIEYGIHDTMWDLILETFAALLTNIYIAAYLKSKKENWIWKITKDFFKLNKLNKRIKKRFKKRRKKRKKIRR